MRILFEENSQKQELTSKEKLQKFYRGTFLSNDGKLILEDLANVSGMYRINFVQNDSQYSSFLEGQRSCFFTYAHNWKMKLII